jgi:hypothetical protein
MINWLKRWIRAVVREETAKSTTLRGIKPGQVFNVTNQDGSVDRVTVRGAAKAKGVSRSTYLSKTGQGARIRIESMMLDSDFKTRYLAATKMGILDGEILLYEETGGYKSHRNGLRMNAAKSRAQSSGAHQFNITMHDHTRTRRGSGVTAPRRSLTFLSEEERDLSMTVRIPLYHEICAEQARKMKGRKA